MLKFYSLYSGSSGNSLLVNTENTNILIDAGVVLDTVSELISLTVTGWVSELLAV